MHRRTSAAVLAGLFVLAPLAATTVISACSVSLDTSRLNNGSSSEAGPAPAYRTCSQDSDCVAAAPGCVTGHCGTAPDGTTNVCLFDQCPTGNACVAASCTSSKCGAPAQYHFNAGSFAIDAGVACSFSGNYQYNQSIPQPCVTALYPFLFIRTTTSILAFDVADPTTSAPPPVAFPPFRSRRARRSPRGAASSS